MCGYNDQAPEEVRREKEKRNPIHVEESRRDVGLHQGFAHDQGSLAMFHMQKTGPDSVVEYKQNQASLIELGKRLRDKSYGDGKFFRRWKLKNSSEMKAILNATDTLTRLMDRPMDKSTYASDLKSVRETYVYLLQSCRTYISTHNPETTEGQLRLDTVKQMEQQVREEMEHLEGCADHVVELEGKHSWSEVLGGARTLKYRDNVDGCKVSLGGAGTSQVYILEGGPKKLFFKEKEPLVQPDYLSVVRAYDARLKQKIDGAASDEERANLTLLQDGFKDVLQVCKQMDGLMAFTLLQSIAQNSAEIKTVADFQKICRPDEMHHHKELESLLTRLNKEDGSGIDLERFKRCATVLIEISKMANAADCAKTNASIGVAGSMEYQTELTSRNVMTSRIAEALGLDDLVAKSKLATVEINGQTHTGMAMEEAHGTEFAKVQKKEVGKTARYSPEAVRQLSNLYILDLLCGQVDRNLNNYFAETQTDGNTVTVTRITGIDNDISFGCLDFRQMKGSGCGQLKSPYAHEGDLQISTIDAELASKILLMNKSQLEMMAVDILTKEETEALCDRLDGIQRMIREAMDKEALDKRKIFMFTQQDWTDFRDEMESADEDTQKALLASGYLERNFMGHVLPASDEKPVAPGA